MKKRKGGQHPTLNIEHSTLNGREDPGIGIPGLG
jgi:hypothetical protein